MICTVRVSVAQHGLGDVVILAGEEHIMVEVQLLAHLSGSDDLVSVEVIMTVRRAGATTLLCGLGKHEILLHFGRKLGNNVRRNRNTAVPYVRHGRITDRK